MSAAGGERPRAPGWVWVAAALSVLTVINLGFASSDPMLELGETSYGKSPAGFGAVYDLLSELDARSARTRVSYRALPAGGTVWLLAPGFLSAGEHEATPEPLRTDALLADELDAFVARGGTALLFGTPESDWSRYGLALAPPPPAQAAPHVALPSTRAPQLRAVELDGLRSFDSALADGFERVLGKPNAPFVVRKAIGKGQLVAVADVRPFANQALDSADHANVAVDLARAFGPPLFDERCHGLLPERSLLAALGGARAALIGCGLGLCLLLALWHLRSVPASTIARFPGLDPGLDGFVDSLALLYSRKAPRDVAAVFRAYLHGVRFRMRQQLYGARGGSDALLAQRLERDFADEPLLLARLRGQNAPRGERELQVAVRELERAVARLASSGRHTRPEART